MSNNLPENALWSTDNGRDLKNELAGHRLAVRMQWVGIAILLGLLVVF